MSERTYLTPEQKVAIIREHLIDRVPVSDLCDRHGISPVVFYNWQRQLFENAAILFERKTNSSNAQRQTDAQQRQIEQIQAKLQQKNEVIAELLQEHVELKKANGEPSTANGFPTKNETKSSTMSGSGRRRRKSPKDRS